MFDQEPRVTPAFELRGAHVLVGTCSWTDPTLVKETDWYPRKSMSAAERLAFYAANFPVVEADSTYYFPPTPELTRSWVERTPPDFTMNVKCYSLLTGHPTFPQSLWEDLQRQVPPEHRDKRRLYRSHLAPDVVAEAWARFHHALQPLAEGGRLGAVLLQYPRWFTPKDSTRELIAEARLQLPDFRLAVEFRNHRWLDGDECERTLGFLEDLDLAFVCVDEPQGYDSSMPPVVAATSDLAIVRFHGRNNEMWERRDISPSMRFRYRYTDDELREWVPKVNELADSGREVHLLMNNCYRDQAVDNAAQLAKLLTG